MGRPTENQRWETGYGSFKGTVSLVVCLKDIVETVLDYLFVYEVSAKRIFRFHTPLKRNVCQ